MTIAAHSECPAPEIGVAAFNTGSPPAFEVICSRVIFWPFSSISSMP